LPDEQQSTKTPIKEGKSGQHLQHRTVEERRGRDKSGNARKRGLAFARKKLVNGWKKKSPYENAVGKGRDVRAPRLGNCKPSKKREDAQVCKKKKKPCDEEEKGVLEFVGGPGEKRPKKKKTNISIGLGMGSRWEGAVKERGTQSRAESQRD